MGLFSNKDKPCPVCGKPTPKLLATKIQGEPICGDCAVQILADSDVRKSWTMDDLKEHLRCRAENKERVENFHPTRTVDCGRSMLIDDANRCFYLKKWSDDNPPIFSFDSITGFEVSIGWNVVEHWGKGMSRTPYQAPQLGVLGTLGALANAFDRNEDKQRQSKSENVKVMLQLDDPYVKKYELMDEHVFGSDELEFARKLSIELARVNAVCDVVAAMAGSASASQAPAAPSAERTADDIIKYKSLMDAGVITQEEFDAKKKQLLGI